MPPSTWASAGARARGRASAGGSKASARAACVVVSALALAACMRERPATSPEDAFLALLAACDSGDAARLFDALDTPTQWAVETVHEAQRQMRGLILSSYPPAERDRALALLPAACDEELERPRRYFRRLDDSAAVLAELRRRIYLGAGQPVGSVRKREGVAEVWRAGGSVFHFSRDDKGRWGLLELREPWERSKERALHDLATVKENAGLYRRLSSAGQAPTAVTAAAPAAAASPSPAPAPAPAPAPRAKGSP